MTYTLWIDIYILISDILHLFSLNLRLSESLVTLILCMVTSTFERDILLMSSKLRLHKVKMHT